MVRARNILISKHRIVRLIAAHIVRRMNDEDGPRIATAIYKTIFKKHAGTSDDANQRCSVDEIPHALDAITREMRMERLPPSRWAPFSHYGA